MGSYYSREYQIEFCVANKGYSYEWYEGMSDSQLYAIFLEVYEDKMDDYYESLDELRRESNDRDDEEVYSRLVESNVVIRSPQDFPKKADGTIDFDALNQMYAKN